MERDRQKNNAEDQIEEIVLKRKSVYHRHDCKHNGCDTAQPRPGHYPDLPKRRTERGKNGSDDNRPDQKCHTYGNDKRRQEYLRKVGWRNQKPQKEKDDDLCHISHYVKKMNQIAFL